VEAFAKVELPVWLSYSLGGGLSTKAAASSLVRGDVNWFSNFFSHKSGSYFDAGGNGAAMRIQPHVWAAGNLEDSKKYMRDVLRNAICTHGHPRAFAGAFFHATCLASAIRTSEIPGPADWRNAIARLSEIPGIIRADEEMNSFWFPVWRQRATVDMEIALQVVQKESLADISLIERETVKEGHVAYPQIVRAIGGLESATRGSGIKTAILASALSWLFKEESTTAALVAAANLLGSDTDSIATMAGAILGSAEKSGPEGDLADREYIEEEASRLYDIGSGTTRESFQYPDLMAWKPPRTLADAVGLTDGHVAVAGLGIAEPIGSKWQDGRDKAVSWQWLKLKFGQTVLARQRHVLSELSDRYQQTSEGASPIQEPKGKPQMSSQTDLFKGPQDRRSGRRDAPLGETSLDELTNAAINSGFGHELIGRHLVGLAEGANGVELAVAYSAIIAKARRARIRVQSKKDQGKTVPHRF